MNRLLCGIVCVDLVLQTIFVRSNSTFTINNSATFSARYSHFVYITSDVTEQNSFTKKFYLLIKI